MKDLWHHNFLGSFSSWTEILWQFKPFFNLKVESYLEHLNGFLLWFQSMCLFITDFPLKLEWNSEHLNCFTVLSNIASLTIWTLVFLITGRSDITWYEFSFIVDSLLIIMLISCIKELWVSNSDLLTNQSWQSSQQIFVDNRIMNAKCRFLDKL